MTEGEIGGHTEAVKPGVEPSCTVAGRTEETYCPLCGEILTAWEWIHAPGHTEVIDPAVEATCTQGGLTSGRHCSVCKVVLFAQVPTPATGHHYGQPADGEGDSCVDCGAPNPNAATTAPEGGISTFVGVCIVFLGILLLILLIILLLKRKKDEEEKNQTK